jgi:anti-sigma factor RsiW
MMACELEKLYLYLDCELEADVQKEVESHLSICRSCRQELARFKLLWLELAEPESIMLPPELPYLRQQAISLVKRSRADKTGEGFNLWGSLRVAWQPFLLGASFIPGAGLLPRLNRPSDQEKQISQPTLKVIGKRIWQFAQRAGKGSAKK